MEEDNKSALEKWLTCSESQVPPSLLASQWDIINTTTQTKSIDLLAQAITPSLSSLSSNNVKEIIQFINTKMDNSSIVPRCMDILLQLVDYDLCDLNQCIIICNMLFQNIPNKKWAQSTRYKILTILGHILQKNVKDINRSQLNFIDGFISVMDGEKDPRNLLLAFDLIKYMIDKLDISRNVEDLFDILFCYFPISFTPPSNDPLAISSDELKLRLRCCLAASPYFAYFATPLLTEKLKTCTGSAKKDAMDTIRMCAPTYGAHVLLSHAKELFETLVKEVYEGNDLMMESIALETIHQIVATLATGISIVNIRDPVEKAIEALLHQAVENLKQPELKHAKSASMILRAAASASDPACTLVVNAVIPLIYQEYNINDSISRQKAILGILIDILEASNLLYGSINSTGRDRDLQTPLTIYKQQILQIFVKSLIHETPFDKQLRFQSLLGIRLMVIMKRFLSIEEIDITVAQLTRFTLDDDKDVRNLVLSTLAIVSKQTSDALIRHTLPFFMKKLESRSKDYYDILSSIKTLVISPVLFCAIIQPLVKELDMTCKSTGENNAEYSYALADCVHHMLSNIEITPDVLHVGQTLLLPTIFNEAVKSTIKDPHCWKMTPPLLNRLGLIAAIIVQNSSSSDQSTIASNAFKVFIDGDIQSLKLPSTTNISYQLFGSCMPLQNTMEEDGDECERDMTIFFPAIIGNCRRDVKLPISDKTAFLKELLQNAIEINCDTRRMSMIQTAASIINKWLDDDTIHFLKQFVQGYIQLKLHGENSIETQKRTLFILIWIVKALITRGHHLGLTFVDIIIKLCHHETLGSDAAEGFDILLHQDDLILNKNSHAIISFLYRQRLFHHCIPQLIQYQDINCLVAISHILVNTPSQVPASEISKLIPSIILSLQLKDHSPLKLSMIKIVRSIVPWATFESNFMNKEHLDPLLEALLLLTNKKEKAIVRLNALQCLAHLASSSLSKKKTILLQPYASTVIRKLGFVLDDKKRLIRKEAVDCREQW
ncbi:unnamed protein product [Cunninghamella blakesleeana]